MFCENCGNQVSDLATACPKCGAVIKNPAAAPQQKPKGSGMATAALVLGILSLFLSYLCPVLPVLGIIFGGIAVSQCGKKAGLIISIIALILTILLYFVVPVVLPLIAVSMGY